MSTVLDVRCHMAWKMALRLPILQGAPIKSNDAKQLVDKADNLALYLANYSNEMVTHLKLLIIVMVGGV